MSDAKVLYSLIYDHMNEVYLVSTYEVLKETDKAVYIKPPQGSIRKAEVFRKNTLESLGLYGSVDEAVRVKYTAAIEHIAVLSQEISQWETELAALKSIPSGGEVIHLDEVMAMHAMTHSDQHAEPSQDAPEMTGDALPAGEVRKEVTGDELPDAVEPGHAVTYENGDGIWAPVIPDEPIEETKTRHRRR